MQTDWSAIKFKNPNSKTCLLTLGYGCWGLGIKSCNDQIEHRNKDPTTTNTSNTTNSCSKKPHYWADDYPPPKFHSLSNRPNIKVQISIIRQTASETVKRINVFKHTTWIEWGYNQVAWSVYLCPAKQKLQYEYIISYCVYIALENYNFQTLLQFFCHDREHGLALSSG